MFPKLFAIEYLIPKLIGKFDYPAYPSNPRLELSQKILNTNYNPNELTFLYEHLEEKITCAFIKNNMLTFHYLNISPSIEVDWTKKDRILAAAFIREMGYIEEKKGEYFRLWDSEENLIVNGICSCSHFSINNSCVHTSTIKVFNKLRKEFKEVGYLVRRAVI
jgi:hypothetical protein